MPGLQATAPVRELREVPGQRAEEAIDAWLIFRCAVCDDRWNAPVYERRSVGTLDPTELDALMHNDPALARRHGWAAIRQAGHAAAEDDPTVRLAILAPATGPAQAIEIILAVTGAGLRLDRLLSRALALGRREIEAMDAAAAITVRPTARKALRRLAVDGQLISIDLAVCPEDVAARLHRLAQAQPPDLYCATSSAR